MTLERRELDLDFYYATRVIKQEYPGLYTQAYAPIPEDVPDRPTQQAERDEWRGVFGALRDTVRVEVTSRRHAAGLEGGLQSGNTKL